jgi:hypothetical protein
VTRRTKAVQSGLDSVLVPSAPCLTLSIRALVVIGISLLSAAIDNVVSAASRRASSWHHLVLLSCATHVLNILQGSLSRIN